MTDIVLLDIKQSLRSAGSWWARPDKWFLIRLTPAPGKLEAHGLGGMGGGGQGRPAAGNHQLTSPAPFNSLPLLVTSPRALPCRLGVEWIYRQEMQGPDLPLPPPRTPRATTQEVLLAFSSLA